MQTHERRKKKGRPELRYQTPSHWPGTSIHASVPWQKVGGHKLFVRMNQNRTSCEHVMLWYNHRPCSLPWRIFCTHIIAVTVVKMSRVCRVQKKSLLTLSVFNYPLIIARLLLGINHPVLVGKTGHFNDSVPCQGWYKFSYTYQLISV